MPWILGVTLTIFVPLSAIYFYVGRTTYRTLIRLFRLRPRNVRTLFWLLAFVFNLFPLSFVVGYLFAGSAILPAFNGENGLVDLLIVYPFWFALVIVVQLFLVYTLFDLGKLFMLPVYRRRKEAWNRWEARIRLIVLIVIIPYSIATIVSDSWTVRIREFDVTLPSRFQGLSGLTIAQISDLQGDGRTTTAVLKEYVHIVNELQPDLILFAGDVVTSGRTYIQSTTDIMGALDATYGVIAVIGDHDMFSDRKEVVEGLQRNGITVVEDSTIYLTINATKLALTGVTFTYRTRPPEKLLESVTSNHDGQYKIFLVHQPREQLVALAAAKAYDLFIAGHTHGGGIAFGIPGVFLVAPSTFETRYLSGFFQEGNMLVSVTNGLGFTLAPIRFHAPAEIILLHLTR